MSEIARRRNEPETRCLSNHSTWLLQRLESAHDEVDELVSKCRGQARAVARALAGPRASVPPTSSDMGSRCRSWMTSTARGGSSMQRKMEEKSFNI